MKAAVRKPRNSAARAHNNPRQRLLLISAILGTAALGLVARAAHLQLGGGEGREQLQRAYGSRALRTVDIPARRGMITDRNGEPLAVSTPVASIWVDPSTLSKSPEHIPALAKALGFAEEPLRQSILRHVSRKFLWLHRGMNPTQADALMALDIPGVHLRREFRRFYPQGEVTAHVLGFADVDNQGQEGLELALNAWLHGKPGKKRVIRDNLGRHIEDVELIEPMQPGKDVALSIDLRIQYLAHRELKNMVEASNAAAGSAIVMDVTNGEVLALSNIPTFNPNNIEDSIGSTRRNRALTDPLEPGSTIKPLTVAAGLEAGVIRADSMFNTSPGWIANGPRYTTKDTRNYGTLSTTGLIQKSSNVGMALISRQLGNQQFYDFLRRFGYGQRTGIGLPESPGQLRDPRQWDGTQKQTMSYGYALNATPLQVVHAYATLGNEGVAIQPTLIRGQQGERRQVLDADIARTVVRMMQTVTEPGGTATQAAILGYHVAGKTGTARKSGAGSYASQQYLAFFAGLVPASQPRYAMIVVIDMPDPSRFGYYGGRVSAPVFHNVMEGTLRLMDVQPDDIDSWIAAQTRQPDLPAIADTPQDPPPPMSSLPKPLPEPLEARQ